MTTTTLSLALANLRVAFFGKRMIQQRTSFVLVGTLALSPFASAQMSLQDAISLANDRDTQQLQYDYQAQATRESSVAAGQLMDPTLKVGIGGLPVDSFSLDDDMMTNLSVGMMQKFSRGDTLDIRQQRGDIEAQAYGYQSDLRALSVTKTLTDSWIELYYLQQVEAVLNQRSALLSRLYRNANQNYALGYGEAQAIVAVEVNQAKVHQQLLTNSQQQTALNVQLSEWLGAQTLRADALPQWPALDALLESQILTTAAQSSTEHEALSQLLTRHPSVLQIDQAIALKQNDVQLAEEAYAPEMGVELMYAHRRANDMAGQQASDLVSVFFTVDVPLFTDKRQDRRLVAAEHGVGAVTAQRDTLLRQLDAQARRLAQDIEFSEQRLAMYQNQILASASERIRAVNRSYQNGVATYAEVVAARDERLMLTIEQHRIEADLHKAKNQLAFLLNQYF
uniref:TolC family protein n=1 Tax=Thaumasiovibrio occultus TaxID=1891184 RepID=UPI000B351259|nr:TolC family protein [Thaumasiovibrio occultus]